MVLVSFGRVGVGTYPLPPKGGVVVARYPTYWKLVIGWVSKMICCFLLPGPLMSYHSNVRGSSYSEYASYKESIRWLANTASIPTICPRGVRLQIYPHWKRAPRLDLSNVVKAIEDGLWRADHNISVLYARHVPFFGKEFAKVVVKW